MVRRVRNIANPLIFMMLVVGVIWMVDCPVISVVVIVVVLAVVMALIVGVGVVMVMIYIEN